MELDIKRIDEKIRERKNVSAEQFIDIIEEVMEFKNGVKRINIRYL